MTMYNVFQINTPIQEGEKPKFIAMFFDADCAEEYGSEYIEGDHHSYEIQEIECASPEYKFKSEKAFVP